MILPTKWLGIAALIGSGVLALNAGREYDVNDIWWADLGASVEFLQANDLAPNLNYTTTRKALTACMMTLGSQQFSVLDDDPKSKIALNCEALAKEAVTRREAHAEAHLIAAFRAVDLGDDVLASAELARSQEYAPVDRFNVEWRLILGHRLAAYGSDRLAAPYKCAEDFDLLATHLPTSQTLNWLREAQSPLLAACGA
jgi:hypothetical protein